MLNSEPFALPFTPIPAYTEAMNPNLRASDDDRQRIADALGEAVSRGQITLPEMEERIGSAWEAVTVADLFPLIDDLIPNPESVLSSSLPVPRPDYPVAPAPVTPPPVSPHSAVGDNPYAPAQASQSIPPLDVAKQYVIPGLDGSSVSACMMFGLERSGDWVVAPQHTNVTIMGGSVIDLTRARLTAPQTTITAVAIMGGIQVIVPEDIRVTVTGIGIMGGFGSSTGKSVTIFNEHLPADAPSVTVNGVAIMGGVDVKRVRRFRTRAELEG